VIKIRPLIVSLVLALQAPLLMAQQLRDPTQPPGRSSTVVKGQTVAKAGHGLVLQTVLIASDRRNAVISGRLLSVGDKIAGYRLVEIREGAVVIEGSRGTRTLRLFPSVTKVEAERTAQPVVEKGLE